MKRLLRTVGVAPLIAALIAFIAWLAPMRAHPAAVLGPVPGAWLRGLELLRGGDAGGGQGAVAAAEAEAALAQAEAALGEAPSPLLRARLHAALLAQQLRAAEFTAEKLVIGGDPPALLDFVHGVTAHVRSRRAAAEAAQPGADPMALDRAIVQAQRAAAAFQRASLAAAGDWPAARRNAERALALLAELEAARKQREQNKKKSQDRVEPEPDPDQIERHEQDLPLDERAPLLTAAELQALLARLAEAEKEKRALRREAQRARSTAVEQDW